MTTEETTADDRESVDEQYAVLGRELLQAEVERLVYTDVDSAVVNVKHAVREGRDPEPSMRELVTVLADATDQVSYLWEQLEGADEHIHDEHERA